MFAIIFALHKTYMHMTRPATNTEDEHLCALIESATEANKAIDNGTATKEELQDQIDRLNEINDALSMRQASA